MVMRPALVRVTLIATIVIGLAGCGPLPAAPIDGSQSPNPSPSPSTPPAASDAPSPSPTPPLDDEAEPVSLPCSTVISPQRMYEFNPNFALLSSFSPTPGSSAATAAAQQGTVCRWVHETNGTTIDVSIARPAPADLEKLVALARSGASLDHVADEAYFSASHGVGMAQAFDGAYWMTISSEYFASPIDPVELLVSVVDSARP